MNRRIFTAALSALLLTGVSAFAQNSTWTIDKNHSQVNFQVRHMTVSNVRGSISGVTGTVVWDDKDPTKSSVEATIDATTVTTNNEARDKHLKSPDFFDVAKNPTLTFVNLGRGTPAGSKSLAIQRRQRYQSVTLDVTDLGSR